MRRATRRPMVAALALIPLLTLTTAACGIAGGDAASAKGTAKAANDMDKTRKYAQCMRANGVDMPDPSDDGGMKLQMKEGGQEKMKAAEAKCRHLQPDGGKPSKPSAQDLAKLRDFAKCMRGQGIDMPDPDADGRITMARRAAPGEKGKPGDAAVTAEEQKMKAAQKACQKYQPKLKRTK